MEEEKLAIRSSTDTSFVGFSSDSFLRIRHFESDRVSVMSKTLQLGDEDRPENWDKFVGPICVGKT